MLQACAVSLALENDPDGPLSSAGFLDALQARVSSPEYREKLRRIGQLLQDKENCRRETAVERLGNGIEASESVPTAIYAFLRHPTSFQEVVTYAISLSGDTDTIASMVGALAGAHLGLEAIPRLWADDVEDGFRLLDLADSLLALASRRGKSKRRRKHQNGC